LAIGPKRKPVELEPGCLVIVAKFAGIPWLPDPLIEDVYLLVFTDEIIAWIEREATDAEPN